MLDPIYDIKFKVGDTDLSKNIYDIEIASNIKSVLHGIILKLRIDSIDIFRNKLFGQNSGILEIILSTVDKTIFEKIYIELVITNIGFIVGIKPSTESIQDHPMSEHIQLHAVPKKSFEIMYTTVCKLFQKGTNLTPIEVVSKITDEFIKCSKKIDTRNINKTRINQLHISPNSYCKSINIINSKYPIYNGILFRFCDIDGVLRISNLSSIIEDASIYNLFVLTKGKDSKDEENILNTSVKSNNFFTYRSINTKYLANSQLVKHGFTKKYLIPKRTELMGNAIIGSDYIYNKLPKSNKKLGIYDRTISEKRLMTDNTLMGEESIKLPISHMSSDLGMPAQIEFTLDGNLLLTDLLKIGIPMELKTDIPNYQEYIGKYIVIMSDIRIRKTTTSYFSSFVTIGCARSNY